MVATAATIARYINFFSDGFCIAGIFVETEVQTYDIFNFLQFSVKAEAGLKLIISCLGSYL